MIKFFRRVRYNLMEQNKTGKYFKYAIGEIFLVVIGILIALSINNWNENRKASMLERELLFGLKTDFEDRLTELEEIQSGREIVFQAIETIFKQINQQKMTLSPKKFDETLSSVMIQWTFNDEFSALDMLFSTGQINNLDNLRLRQILINWPSLVEEMLEEQRRYVTNSDDLINVMKEHLVLNNLVQHIHIRDWQFGTQLPNINFKHDRQGLIESTNFTNELTEQRMLLYINLIDGEKLIHNAKEIIRLIEKQTAK